MLPPVRVALVAAAALSACGAPAGPGARTPEAGGRRLTSLVLDRADGGQFDLEELVGHPSVILLFTTYSLYSQHLVTLLVPVWERHSAEGLEVVAISTEPEAPEILRAWRDFLEIPFPVVRGDDSLHRGVSPLGPIEVVPLLLLVDRSGAIVERLPSVEDEHALDEAVGRLF